MKLISVFNNKGGVGKTTLTFHIAHALASQGLKVLIIDADPQCNLTIYAIDQDDIHNIWEEEDAFIDGFESARNSMTTEEFTKLNESVRSLHYLLKPTEEGTGELSSLPPPKKIADNIEIIPGRLTLHLYEEKVAVRWPDMYRGDPLAIRTTTRIRKLAEDYAKINAYDYVIVDTSPSLGALNKVIISTVDGFILPALPDLFSLYGIRNIGMALYKWKEEFDIVYKLISEEKRSYFPKNFVTFLGYTIYNAKKYTKSNTTWNLAQAHLNYALKIPDTIKQNIRENMRSHLTDSLLESPIGGESVMHTHNTFPSMAQYYHTPMWSVPNKILDDEHISTINGSKSKYFETLSKYQRFCDDLLARISLLDQD